MNPKHLLSNYGRTISRVHGHATGENDFQGCQLSYALPMSGRIYVEVEVVRAPEEASRDHWFGIGVADASWSPISTGWWQANHGHGWYSAGQVYEAGTARGSQKRIVGGDTVGCELDRDLGKVSFYHTGEKMPIEVSNPALHTLPLFFSFILLGNGSITVKRVGRRPESH
jgi:hypothetical protein